MISYVIATDEAVHFTSAVVLTLLACAAHNGLTILRHHRHPRSPATHIHK